MNKRVWIAIISLWVFVICEIVLVRFVMTDRDRQVENKRYLALEQLSTIRARLEGLLQTNLIAIRQLHTELTLEPEISEYRFAALTENLMSQNLHIRHLAIAQDFQIRMIYPLAGNESALGFDYRTRPDQLRTLHEAISNRTITLNGPVALAQGGEALIARVPVFSNNTGELLALISQVIDHESLFSDAGLLSHPELNISLRGLDGTGAQGELITGHYDVWDANPVELTVSLPRGEWKLAAVPLSGDWAPADRTGSLYLIFGTLLALLIAAMTYLLLRNQQRLRQAFGLISNQARFDNLTGLANRHFFEEQLSTYMSACERRDEKFALLFIDLDHFKEVNDALGHSAGDDLLKLVTGRLQASLRRDDIVARLGGDEFVVVLKNLSEPFHAQLQAQKLLKHIREPMNLGNNEVSIGASIGIALFPRDGDSHAELLKAADLAMYAAKDSGRGTSEFFNDELREQASTHLHMHQAILQGIRNNDFLVHYQPVINSKDGSLHSIEALARWKHPTRGLLLPKDFIAIAEKSGAIRELGNFVLNCVCMDIPALQAAGMKGRVAINFSSHQFYDKVAMDHWFQIMQQHQVDPTCFTFEITESMLLPDRERQRDLLLEVNDRGVTLAIDDFGTGYSSASYLKHFPISLLKIDRTFVTGVPDDPHQNALLSALIHMARALNIDVVIEGVETVSQVNFLNMQTANLIQGFYFAKPMPLEQLIERYGNQPLPKGPRAQNERRKNST
ncbi:EAL domain-containing protein [Aliidiomarina halalkaliphila]|uniref:EAL domain-containing protein n=1 Tax=Aliidiomarina halalkaliphila TaxID=2593535 RepID=A0A552X5W4_9GAMM|nr:EAL domain-containing protein [Aliidiomarina halalkaliphila]TRW50417.1 EAL domain-containing protein [Aliidiomarina halalkaliphila]